MIYGIKRKRKRKSKLLPYIIGTTSILLFVSSMAVIFYDGGVKNTGIMEDIKSSQISESPIKKEEVEETPVDYIRDIEDHSSEINGEWLGLCDKDAIKNVSDFRDQVEKDIKLRIHFNDFQWENAVIRYLDKPADANVFHRKGDYILPSRKVITLPKGDGYITDGKRVVRTHCCNDVKPVLEDDFQPYTKPPKEPKKEKPIPEYDIEILKDPLIPEKENVVFDNHTVVVPRTGFSRRATPPDTIITPEPETLILFGTGLFFLLCRKKLLTWFSK